MPSEAALPRLSAVVVHYGDPAATRRCLDSLAGADPAALEVILVDQMPVPCGHHPVVTTRLDVRTNLGFAAACNRGVAAARAPWILLVNNDAVMEAGAVDLLLAELASLEASPDVAGACLKLLGMDGVSLQSAAGHYFTRDFIGFPNGFGELDNGQYDALPESRVGVPSGAAAVYRASAWREAGGMATEFFCYCEDGDLGLRIVAAGGRFAWLPSVRVRHELSATSGAHSRFKAYHVERNHFLVAVHVAPASVLAMLPLWTLLRLARTAWDAARGHGAGAALARGMSPVALAVTLLGAWADAIGMSRGALARRRAIGQREADAITRTRRFVETRTATAAEFGRSR